MLTPSFNWTADKLADRFASEFDFGWPVMSNVRPT